MAGKKKTSRKKGKATKKKAAKKAKRKTKKRVTKKKVSSRRYREPSILADGGIMKWSLVEVDLLLQLFHSFGRIEDLHDLIEQHDFMVEIPAALVNDVKQFMHDNGMQEQDMLALWMTANCNCGAGKYMPNPGGRTPRRARRRRAG